MTLSQKETTLLQDLKSQEQLCIEKYNKYSQMAHDTELKTLFTNLAQNEQKHLDTVTQILGGTEVKMPSESPSATTAKLTCTPSSCNEVEKKNDAYLCKDALAMEKHVSSVYDMTVFEFTSPTLRDTLAHIQKEEQNHGEKLYNYLSCNNMYQ
ncbi:MAG: ferritin-like domain-containing protein [Ruminococcaceae bacterium]|nr:ferritin-like domain-containing protein [Oscillospiraceae bacterium]